MALADTLNRLEKGFGELGTGRLEGVAKDAIFSDIAQAFAQLKVDLAATTGWAAATGTATRSTFVTSTVTTAALAERVKALLDDFLAKGTLST